jgi:glycosyltransferase involved in cell wall biosynthesis
MKISGFTYVRNGFKYGYPFIPSIRSLLPLVDELIVVVGDSEDGTRNAIAELHEPKIRIIDTVWDDALRENGKVFAQQANLGLANITGDWAIHLQVDEVLHEKDHDRLLHLILEADNDPQVEGLGFPFYHFWGDFNHIRNTRKTHPFEIRAFKNQGTVRSYKDSQGFRKYASEADYANGGEGTKLKVWDSKVPVYHYSYSRNPSLMKKKAEYFNRFWHDDAWVAQHAKEQPFDFNEVDHLEPFGKSHPMYMKEVIAAKDWDFQYDPSRSNMSFKDRVMFLLNRWTGKRLFEFKNYKLIRKK